MMLANSLVHLIPTERRAARDSEPLSERPVGHAHDGSEGHDAASRPARNAELPEMGRWDQPLAHVALTLQFSCQANFTRAFREATGQTPAQYRRSVGMIATEPAAKNDNS
jgi:AraC-like DNA-binding protein